MIDIKVVNLSKNPLPQYETEGSAGMDLRCDLSRVSDQNPITCYGYAHFNAEKQYIDIAPNTRAMLPSGLKVEIPQGYQIAARPRSGLSFKRGITLCNATGTIDSDFRGEIMIPVINLSDEHVVIHDGERICQIILEKVNKINWINTDNLSETDRGEGGFGSTGKK